MYLIGGIQFAETEDLTMLAFCCNRIWHLAVIDIHGWMDVSIRSDTPYTTVPLGIPFSSIERLSSTDKLALP